VVVLVVQAQQELLAVAAAVLAVLFMLQELQ
jgi:hypothetical protein